MAADINALQQLGFRPQPLLVHWVEDRLNKATTGCVTLASADGSMLARIWRRTEGVSHKPTAYLDFLSLPRSGSWIWSTNAKAWNIAPDGIVKIPRPNTDAAELFDAHRAHLPATERVILYPEQQARQALEQLHASILNFHRARGVFRPLNTRERELMFLAWSAPAVRRHRNRQIDEACWQNYTSWKPAELRPGAG